MSSGVTAYNINRWGQPPEFEEERIAERQEMLPAFHPTLGILPTRDFKQFLESRMGNVMALQYFFNLTRCILGKYPLPPA